MARSNAYFFSLHNPHLQLLLLQTLPTPLLCDQLGSTLTDTKDSQHGVDSRHFGEDTGVSDTHALEAADLKFRVDNGLFVLGDVAHLGSTSRVVDGVSDATAVLGKILIGSDVGARCDFALNPVGEWGLLGDFSRGLETSDDGSGIVTLGISEIAEVESRLDVGVGRSKVEAAARAGTGNVGGHAEGVDRRVVTQTVIC